LLALAAATNPQARADFLLGAAGNYTILAESGVMQVALNGGTVHGNIGIDNPSGQLNPTASGSVLGNADFVGPTAIIDQPSRVFGTVSTNVSAVSTATADYQMLSTTSNTNATTTVGTGMVAPNVALTSNTTIDITMGKKIGETYYFNVTSVNLSGGPVTINGINDPAGNVVFNFPPGFGNVVINGSILLAGGLDTDSVLFNVAGTNQALTTSTNRAPINGIFLDPGGTISVDDTTVNGRIFGGDNNNLAANSGTTVNGPNAIPEPSALASACFLVVIGLGYSWHRKRRAA
jgi:hypothetical protein